MKTKVWAHRGASGYAPENTLEAFELAVNMHADAVELDVQMSKDSKLVVIHDETIDRVSEGSGEVRNYTLEELKQFNVNRTHPEYSRVCIPTLQEVFDLLKPTNLMINVELKTGIIFYPCIEEAVLQAAADLGMEERIWYSSFNHYTLLKMKELNPKIQTGVLYSDGIYQPAAYAKSLHARAVHPAFYNLLYPKMVKECKENGIKIHSWTINEEKDILAARELGIDAVITNYPDRASRILKA
jgi:glycerophosphoryl diester phosphodiesterase